MSSQKRGISSIVGRRSGSALPIKTEYELFNEYELKKYKLFKEYELKEHEFE